MPAQTCESLLADLRRLRLLTDDAGERLATAARLGVENFPRLLVEAGLTRFQVRVAIAGHAARLVFGPYVLLDKIGEGGMGVVYKARHARTGRVDAVKVLRADKVESRTVAKRFLREIQVTSRLEHPHVVRAYDAGRIGKQLYLATEYINGTDLGTVVLTRGALSVADACLVIYQAALALRHIHEKGLVHRDLKPSNLIRDHATGAVKILDLGLSGFNTAVSPSFGGGTLTRDGVLLGTPDFMAPEQVQNPHAVDIRADLYSLGCTFFFLLTGKPPYDGTPVEKMYHHGFTPPPPLILPNGLAPPVGLAETLARLMAKRPDERFQTPQALIDALLALRPGSTGNTGPIDHTSVAAMTPPPVDDLPNGHFDHLLSGDNPVAGTPLTRSLKRPGTGISRTWMIGAVVALLFGLGFITAAAYFSGPKKPVEQRRE
jgi:serine/threonine-protein kinase